MVLAVVTPSPVDDPPWLDTAISWTLLQRANRGEWPETFRIARPPRLLAFGPADRTRAGFEAAREAARDAGFTPLHRLAGGRAAVFHPGTLAFSWTVPRSRARASIHERFASIAALVAEAIRGLGVDARVGAVPGEYCPGDYSVNAGGRTKLMGVGQRVLVNAAHVGGVLVVDDAAAVRDALRPVYRALGYSWDPAATGSVRDEVAAVTWEDVADALLATIAAHRPSERVVLPTDVLDEALGYAPLFADTP